MPEATSAAPTWTLPTRLDAAWLRLRVWGLVVLRAWRDLRAARVQRHVAGDALQGATVVAERRSPLWRDGREDEFRLVAGKVENLRVARRAFDGVVVPAGAVFSFWKQLGRPTRGRGFVEGREIRAGCVVPVVAGGLCQLSNALAACALECGIALVERHAHTARIERDAAASDAADATVSWNYVDLRLQAPFDWRLEVELTGDELVVRMRAAQARAGAGRAIALVAERPAAPLARGCLTCDERRCFRHPGPARAAPAGRAAVLVDTWTPEFERWLRTPAVDADWFTPWQRRARRAVGAWTPPGAGRHVVARRVAWRRSALLRRLGEGSGRQEAVLRANGWIAHDFARRLEPRHAELVVDQALLVPLADMGALQGRHYDVLVHALPADELQRRLDAAAQRWPDAASLRDFRVDTRFGDAELRALRGARRLVTPHADVARHLRGLGLSQVECVAWQLPAADDAPRTTGTPASAPLVAFPASALARKGAHELAQALRQLGWRLLVLGTPSTDAALWQGVAVEHMGWRDASWLARADVVALPAHVEHAPRALLKALAHGLPVVATAACGLGTRPGVREVAPGDVAGLVAALEAALADARAGT
jgi:glycosyltransferase involved in cell wall biosynthesis